MKVLKMKAFITFAALFTIALSSPAPQLVPEEDDGVNMKYFLVDKSNGMYEVEDLVNSKLDTRASKSDIAYYFFTKKNPDAGFKIASVGDIQLLRPTGDDGSSTNFFFNPEKDTVFFIHGWQDSNVSDFSLTLRKAAISAYDVNVFVVDWQEVAKRNYISARFAVVRLGTYVAELIQALAFNFQLDYSKVTIAAHSLGAQIAGEAGQVLKGQVGHIVGLDPAFPLFSPTNIDDRLDQTDAKFVQVIHTNAGFLGFKGSIGHADYFPNGGSNQKGCGLDIGRVCSHCRSWMYFAESLLGSKFVSTSCESYSVFTSGNCRFNSKAYMGGIYPDNSASGAYYLDTNKQAPFALG